MAAETGPWRFVSKRAIAAILAIAGISSLDGCSSPKSPGADAKQAEPATKWVFNASGGLRGALALADDGTLYAAGRDNYLYAIHPDGQLAWKRATGAPIMTSPLIGPDGTIYVVNAAGRVFAINFTGTEQWHSDLPATMAFESGSATDGNWLYTPARHGLCAVRLSNGEVQWETVIPFAQWGSPFILGNSAIVYPGHGRMNAVDHDGSRQWEYPVLTQEAIDKNGGWPPPGPGYSDSASAVGPDGTIYGATGNSRFMALNGDGTLQWEVNSPMGNRASPVVSADGTVYFEGGDSKLYAFEPGGTKKWDLQTGDARESSPLLAEDGTIYVGGTMFYAISPDGKVLWTFNTRNETTTSPALAPDGTLYVATDGGKIFAFPTTGGGLMHSSWPKYQRDPYNRGAVTNR
jgi:outer membrane protein assembly factor BamB